MGHKSLKAWKIEHDKEVAANESKNRKKSPKGTKSPTGGKESKAAGKDAKADKNSLQPGKEGRPKSGKSSSPGGGKPSSPKPKSSRESSPKGKVRVLFFNFSNNLIKALFEFNKK
jgi:hypothetical protein